MDRVHINKKLWNLTYSYVQPVYIYNLFIYTYTLVYHASLKNRKNTKRKQKKEINKTFTKNIKTTPNNKERD